MSERIEVSIVWQNGKVVMKAPANPIMVMKVLGDALSAVADEFIKMTQKETKGKILVPGPGVTFADQRVVNAAKGEKNV